jgi:hypothetical protein
MLITLSNPVRFGSGRFRLVALMCTIAVLAGVAPPLGKGQSSSRCKVGAEAPGIGFWTWASGAKVKIYIVAQDFKQDEIPFLLAPVRQWNAATLSTSSGVTLSYEGTTSKLLDCENCVTIMRAPIFNRDTHHGSELRAFSVEGTKIIRYAAVVIDRGFTNPQILTNAVAHELGHSFGLADCYNCKSGSTVMNKFKGMNVSNGMEGPTACDLKQVRTAYAELRSRHRPAVAAIIQVDEGEEPVEDNTPLVVPDQ